MGPSVLADQKSPLASQSPPMVGADERVKAFQEKSETEQSEIGKAAEATRERVSKLEEQRGALKAPELTPVPPPPKPEATDPIQAWGSLAMLMAAAGGLRVRNHAAAAANAAAEVLKGFHQGDKERNDENFARWKAINDNVLKTENYQLRAYNAILADLRGREGKAINEGSLDVRAAIGETAAMARSFQDGEMVKRAEAGDWRGMVKLQDDREKLALEYEKASGKIAEGYTARAAIDELRQTPEYQAADARTRYGMELAIWKEKAPQLDRRGDGSPNDIKIAKQVFPPPPGSTPVQMKQWEHDFAEWYRNEWPDWAGGPAAAGIPKAPAGQMMRDPDGKLHRYKGTGDPRDPANYEPVDETKPAKRYAPRSC